MLLESWQSSFESQERLDLQTIFNPNKGVVMDSGQQGITSRQVGQNIAFSVGEFSDQLFTELQGRSFEQTYRGNKYATSTAGGGAQLAAACLFSTAFSSFTPILALYNPIGNTKMASLTRIWCGLSATPLATAAQTGAFMLVTGVPGQSITNAQSSTGPVNCGTLKATGSTMVGITLAVLAGYLPTAGTPTIVRPLSGSIVGSTATASVTELSGLIVNEESAGGIIVPPGQFIAIANGISNAVSGMLVTAGFEWDEVSLV